MRRRQFIGMLGGAGAWPLAARAQQSAMPVIGFFRSTPSGPFMHLVTAFRRGLNEAGFVEGQNVTIDYRYADNQLDRLPALAAELIRRRVAVIVGNTQAIEAARAATATIPIVFVVADDPVRSGLVASFSRPGANLTGVTFFAGSQLNAKRLEMLRELVPKAAIIGVLGDANYDSFEPELPRLVAASRSLGLRLATIKVGSEREFDAAFARIVQAGAGALLVSGSPLFSSQRKALVSLAARHAIPTIYDIRDIVEAGGLISYGASITDAYRRAGEYAGRILKGAKPSELPILQPTTFELVINLKTAKTLKLDVPSSIILRADEVIE